MPASPPVEPPDPSLRLAVDVPLVMAVAEANWATLGRAPGRTWFSCQAASIHDRRATWLDPLRVACAEARDLTDPDAELRLRVVRVGLGQSEVQVGGVGEARARRFLRAVEQGVEAAADPESPAHPLWTASSDAAALAEAGGRALRTLGDEGAEECGRRGGWLLAGEHAGSTRRADVLARAAVAPDGCTAGLARAWEAAGAPLGELLDTALAGEATRGRLAHLRGSRDHWPATALPRVDAAIGAWEATLAQADARAEAAFRAEVDALDPPLRACFDLVAPTLATGPGGAAVARDPRAFAGQLVAWTLPWALWTAEETGGSIEDGRGGVAWSVRVPVGTTLPVAAEGPTALVIGAIEPRGVRGPDGRPRWVPEVVVRCVPSVELPASLRPTWTPLGGWVPARPVGSR